MADIQQLIKNNNAALLSAKTNPAILEGAIKECSKNLKNLNSLLKKCYHSCQEKSISKWNMYANKFSHTNEITAWSS